jgi:hypothetical protein
MNVISQKVRSILPCGICLVGILGYGQGIHTNASSRGSSLNQHAVYIMKFQKGVEEYVSLHKNAAAQMARLKPTESPEKIAEYQLALASKIRAQRPNAKQGDLFTAPVVGEFRRLIRLSLQGGQGARIRASLHASDPVQVKIVVNGLYPPSVPLETMPPSLLHNLPELPAEVEYRFVGHDLVLRDVTASLIVDFIPNAIP